MTYKRGQKVYYSSGVSPVTVLDGPFRTLECPNEDCYEVRMSNGWIGTMREVDLSIVEKSDP